MTIKVKTVVVDVVVVVTMRHYASATYVVVVCPFVRLSVCHKPALYTKMDIRRITQATPYDSPGTLVL